MNILARSALRATVSYAVVLSVATCAAVSALGHDLDAWPAAIAETRNGAATPARQLTDSIDDFAASVTHAGAIASFLQADTPALDAAFDTAGQAFDAIAASLAPAAARSAIAAGQLLAYADDCADAMGQALAHITAAQPAAAPNAAAEHSVSASSRRHAALQ